MTLYSEVFPSLELLADRAGSVLRTPISTDNAFATDVLVVEGRGLEQWLTRELTGRMDVLANVQFISPTRYVELLESLSCDNNLQNLGSLQLAILNIIAKEPQLLPPVLQHLSLGEDSPASALLVNWSRNMANTFGRYRLYRNEWLSKWEKEPNSSDWQEMLWHRLIQSGPGSALSTSALNSTINHLQTEQSISIKHPRWIIVEPKQWSPVHKNITEALATYADVYVLKYEIPVVENPAPEKIRLYSCYSALRQTEVLKDNLLAALNADPELQTRDILVLTPDLATYVPLLQSVFHVSSASGTEDSPNVPSLRLYAQGGSPRRVQPVADVMLKLLALSESRVSSNSILNILESDVVSDKFGYDRTTAVKMRSWIASSGIRWGLDSSDPMRAEMNLGDEGTWRRGINRMMLSTVMYSETDSEIHYRQHAPATMLDAENAESAGALARAVRLISDITRRSRLNHTLFDWMKLLEAALDAMVGSNEKWASGKIRFRKLLGKLADDSLAHQSDRKFSASAISSFIEGKLEEPLASPGRYGTITVAPLANGWIYPSKIIALLGMDDGVFPTGDKIPWYDKIASAPQEGDPNERDEQIRSLAHALNCAQDKLIVTFTGWNKAGTLQLPPSTALATISTTPLEPILTPLQPFSRRAFSNTQTDIPTSNEGEVDDKNRTFIGSYDSSSAAVSAIVYGEKKPDRQLVPATNDQNKSSDFSVLPLYKLQRFLDYPSSEVLSRFGIYTDISNTKTYDVLDLSPPNNLESKAIKLLVEKNLSSTDASSVFDYLRHTDTMPTGVLGEAWTVRIKYISEVISERVRRIVGNNTSSMSVDINLTIDDTHITGSIDGIYGDTIVSFSNSKRLEYKYLVSFVNSCLVRESGAKVKKLALINSSDTVIFDLESDNRDYLNKIVRLYHEAGASITPFIPSLNRKYVECINIGYAPDRALNDAEDLWSPKGYSSGLTPEGKKEANMLLHIDSPVLHPIFSELSLDIFEPIFSAMNRD